MLNSSDDMALYMEGATAVNITRLHRATPPLQGTFDVEIFGGRAEGSYNTYITVYTSTHITVMTFNHPGWCIILHLKGLNYSSLLPTLIFSIVAVELYSIKTFKCLWSVITCNFSCYRFVLYWNSQETSKLLNITYNFDQISDMEFLKFTFNVIITIVNIEPWNSVIRVFVFDGYL